MDSATGTTGINVNPPITGWAVWFLAAPGADPAAGTPAAMPEAARLVANDCQARGIRVEIIQLPDPPFEDIVGRLWNGQNLILTASRQPSISPAAARILVVAPNAVNTPARSIVVDPQLQPADVALRIVTELEQSKMLPPADEVYSEEEEERLRSALDDLGYL
jgi:hypothetical protein